MKLQDFQENFRSLILRKLIFQEKRKDDAEKFSRRNIQKKKFCGFS